MFIRHRTAGCALLPALSAFLFCFLPAVQLGAISIRHDRAVGSYNALGALHPAAGYLGLTTGGRFCSGLLVAPNKILTAAHCFDFTGDGNLNITANQVSFGLDANVPSGTLPDNITAIDIHPQWSTSGGAAQFDLAVLTWEPPPAAPPPAPLWGLSPLGMEAIMVGYGQQGDGENFPNALTGANDKLGAQNVIDFWDNGILMTDFDSPDGNTNTMQTDRGIPSSATPLDLEGTTAPGDSGGPIFVDINGTFYSVGVLHGGFNDIGPDSRYGDISIWASFQSAANRNFLVGHGIAVIPEPATAFPFALVLLAAAYRRKRRRP